jgi:hypothetical protein
MAVLQFIANAFDSLPLAKKNTLRATPRYYQWNVVLLTLSMEA